MTYQLADPEPLTVDEALTEMCRATDRRGIRVRLPRTLATWALDHVPGVYRLLRIPSSAVEYFVHPTHYDTTNATRDLAGSGVECPRLPDYLDNLVGFMRDHRDANVGAMT